MLSSSANHFSCQLIGWLHRFLSAPTHGAFLHCIPVGAVLLVWSLWNMLIGIVTVHDSTATCITLWGVIVLSTGITGALATTCIVRGRVLSAAATVLLISEIFIGLSRITSMFVWAVECAVGTWLYPTLWEDTFNKKMGDLYGEELQQHLGLYYDPVGSVLTVLIQVTLTVLVSGFVIQLTRSYFRIIDAGGSSWEGECAEDLSSAATANTRFMRFMNWMQRRRAAERAAILSASAGGAGDPTNDGGMFAGYRSCAAGGMPPAAVSIPVATSAVSIPMSATAVSIPVSATAVSIPLDTAADYPAEAQGMHREGFGHSAPRMLVEADYALDPADMPGNRIASGNRGRPPSSYEAQQSRELLDDETEGMLKEMLERGIPAARAAEEPRNSVAEHRTEEQVGKFGAGSMTTEETSLTGSIPAGALLSDPRDFFVNETPTRSTRRYHKAK